MPTFERYDFPASLLYQRLFGSIWLAQFRRCIVINSGATLKRCALPGRDNATPSSSTLRKASTEFRNSPAKILQPDLPPCQHRCLRPSG